MEIFRVFYGSGSTEYCDEVSLISSLWPNIYIYKRNGKFKIIKQT